MVSAAFMRMLIVTVTVITATTVINMEIIGPSFPPGSEIPRSVFADRGALGTFHANGIKPSCAFHFARPGVSR
jgi:hypothetical protein